MNETVGDLAERLLSRLPSDPDLIAAKMYAAMVKGIPTDHECCVVARWMRIALRVPHVSVDVTSIEVTDEQGNTYIVKPPPCLESFIEEFDDFAFPYLVDHYGSTFEEKWDKQHAA